MAYSDLQALGLVSDNTTELFHKGVRDNSSIDVYKDVSSGLIFIKDNIDNLTEYQTGSYHADFHDGSISELTSPDLIGCRDLQRRLSSFEQFYIQKDIIDFGCGDGSFLIHSGSLANSTYGIELQQSYLDHLQENGVKCSNNLDSIAPQSIDSIFLFHSFEHLHDPIAQLLLVFSKLRSGGHIIIEVPSADDFLIGTIKSPEFIDFTLWSQHVVLHTHKSLNRFLEYVGFQNILIRGCQRYSLSNHLKWISQGTPGGQMTSLSMLDNDELSNVYEKSLSMINANDTLVAVAQKP